MQEHKEKQGMGTTDAIMKVRGYNGQMLLYPDKVRIMKTDAYSLGVKRLAHGLYSGVYNSSISNGSEVEGGIDVPISQIMNVEFARAGRPPSYETGYIKLNLIGEPKTRTLLKHARLDFQRQQEAEFEALRAAIVKKIDEARMPEQQTQPQSSLLDELGKLATLRDRGVLTEQEFQTYKKEAPRN